MQKQGFPGSTWELACQRRRHEMMVQFLGWEDPLEKEMTTTPVFLPGEFHGQRNPWGHKSQIQLSD